MKLYERIPIDTWKRIADVVQKLRMYDSSFEEFNSNLEELKEMLFVLDISLEVGERYPNTIKEVGLASLLQAIYSSNVENDYKKANFYEKIYQLDDLDIPSIEFRPINFVDRVDGITFLRNGNSGDVIGINKCFTDGEFDIIYSPYPLLDVYGMTNFKEVNYLINVLVRVDNYSKRPVIDTAGTYAVLRNFDGIFPNKESIEEIRYPGLCTYSKRMNDDRIHLILKQIFYTFDTRKAQYSKRLVREPNNFHYE